MYREPHLSRCLGAMAGLETFMFPSTFEGRMRRLRDALQQRRSSTTDGWGMLDACVLVTAHPVLCLPGSGVGGHVPAAVAQIAVHLCRTDRVLTVPCA